MEASNESTKNSSKETIIKEAENLTVYIRVRPKLSNEYLKETATYVNSEVICKVNIGKQDKDMQW